MEFICSNLSRGADGQLLFAGQKVEALARQWGTPLYLMDEDRFVANCRRLQAAVRSAFDDRAQLYYAGKAACFKQLYRILQREGLSADAVSMGEAATALAAGLPAERLCLHGCAKTDEQLSAAVQAGIGLIAVDNSEELQALSRLAQQQGKRQPILLRLTPGVDPHTFHAVTTGTVDSKFGFAIPTGDARRAVREALRLPGVQLQGYHCHIGSQIFSADPFCSAAQILLDFTAQLREETGFYPEILDLGGGFGVRYTAADPVVDPADTLAALGAYVHEKCAQLHLPLPRILLEPGRSLVADTGLAVYTVQAVKKLSLSGSLGETELSAAQHPAGVVPSIEKNYLLVDGGMADNPRFALYGAHYTVLAVHAAPGLAAPLCLYDVAGCCCESGDVLAADVLLPGAFHRGDLLAVCTAGAYQFSMASNYNRLPRPPVVLLQAGQSRLAVRRQTDADLQREDE